MKKLAIFTLIAMLLVSLTVPFSSAAATSNVILKSTPVVDGKLDEAYLVSACAVLEEKNFWSWGGCEGTDTDATIYYLYDDTNLYYFVDVYDTTTITSNVDDWMNDGCEMRFIVGDTYYKVVSTVGLVQDGYVITDGKDEEGDKIDLSNFVLKSAVKADGTGYTLEASLPLASIGATAAAGSTIGATMQINDVIAEDRSAGSAFGGFRVFEARKGIQNHTYTLSADAANPNLVLKHTPTLDGVIDDAYLKSSTQTLKNLNFWGWAGDPAPYAAATAYLLWDDNFLYVAVDVKDETVVTTNEDPSMPDSNADNLWRNDSAELWFNDEDLVFKIHAALGGLFFVGTDEDGRAPWDITKGSVKGAVKDGGYSLEIALPLNNLVPGRVVVMEMQINDTYDDARTAGWASGGKGAYDTAEKTFILTAEQAEASAPVADDPTPVVDPTPGTTPANPAPATLDAGVVVAAVALVSLAGIVVAKKKH